MSTTIEPNPARTASTPSGHNEPILIFKGGGYDGCIWEWNAIFFTPRPYQVANAQATGYAGKAVLKAAQVSLREAVKAAAQEGDWHLITTDASWEKFGNDFNKGFVRNVAKVACRECQCDKCKGWFTAYEIVHTGYRGDGGIGVQYDDNHCTTCAEELHEQWCSEHEWPSLSIKERLEAIGKYREESGGEISAFAARAKEAPIPYSYYAGEPEYY